MTETFAPDRPISDPKDDRYGRAPFAMAIANAIRQLPKGECFVIGIDGAWGEGKSTVLEMTARSLQSGSPAVAFRLFNPWRFTNDAAMIAMFFETVAKALDVELESKAQRAAGKLSAYLKYLSVAHDAAATASELLATMSQTSLEDSRGAIRKELLTKATQAVIFIDDIDRLHADEAALLFRALKACADLPNIIYVLAFDRKMVASTLQATIGGTAPDAGERYLEKIIQIPLSLPPASAVDLRRVCNEGVLDVLEKCGLPLSPHHTRLWADLFEKCVSNRIKTPRGVTQYLNAVRFAVPLLAGRVNLVDLLLVEALRVYYPQAYAVIRDNPRVFAGWSSTRTERTSATGNAVDPMASVLHTLDARDSGALEFLIHHLFPQYRLGKANVALSADASAALWRDRRVAWPPYFDHYFTYSVTEEELGQSELDSIIRAASASSTLTLRSLVEAALGDGKQESLARHFCITPPESQSSIDQSYAFETDILTIDLQSLPPPPPPNTLQGMPYSSFVNLSTAFAQLSSLFEQPYSFDQRGHPGLTLCREIGFRIQTLGEDVDDAVACALIQQSVEIWFAAAVYSAFVEGVSASRRVSLKATRVLEEQLSASIAPDDKVADPQRPWKLEAVERTLLVQPRGTWRKSFMATLASDMRLFARYLETCAQPLDPDTVSPYGADVSIDTVIRVRQTLGNEFITTNVMPHLSSDVQCGPDYWPDMLKELRVLAQFWYYWTHPSGT